MTLTKYKKIKMKILKAKEEDMIDLRKLILYCIKKNFNNYPNEKINAMKEYSSKYRLKEYLNTTGWEIFVCVENDKLLGTISVQDNKVIFSLYAVNEDIRKELIDFVGKICRKRGSKKLIAIVMPENKKDFESQGFRVVEKLILPFKDIKFDEYKMEKIKLK